MPRIYGEEQRQAVRRVRLGLIEQIEELYLNTFDQLNDMGFGDGVLAKLTQLLLISRDGALLPLQEGIESKTSKMN
ncbi:hercynine metabolism small protein [Prochlorococcus sp. MIT 1307]|uniref:hercynine metabolism small protein n=1 Tax=Prochlorococcus sp. MIT 1307 TaxID=3096219 RepID=UPI002A763255|nr:hercynine metabolism small protein [Prochlorococcus sp. MIT 1307]